MTVTCLRMFSGSPLCDRVTVTSSSGISCFIANGLRERESFSCSIHRKYQIKTNLYHLCHRTFYEPISVVRRRKYCDWWLNVHPIVNGRTIWLAEQFHVTSKEKELLLPKVNGKRCLTSTTDTTITTIIIINNNQYLLQCVWIYSERRSEECGREEVE